MGSDLFLALCLGVSHSCSFKAGSGAFLGGGREVKG